MSYKTFLIVNAVLLSTVMFTEMGCQRLPEKPDGLPTLHPCTVAVTFGGSPMEGVNIALVPSENTEKKWQAGGATNQDGKAIMKTSAVYPGVPEGKYVISFSKTQQREGKTIAEMASLSLIPLKYSLGESKEIAEIKPGKNDLTFTLDAGEEVEPQQKRRR